VYLPALKQDLQVSSIFAKVPRHMLKIRMQRTGRINQPSYRIIVTEHTRSPKTGNFVEELGTYNPSTKARTLKDERVKYWLSVGAKPSGTMHNMLVSTGIISGKKVNVLPKKTVAKKEEAAPAEVAAVAAPQAAPAEETPAGEAPTEA
jgi:small subunit ribosomal protein S16